MNQETTLDDDPLTAPEQLFPLVRHLSYRLTPLLLKTSVTPNQITTVSLLLGLACAVCFIQGSWVTGIIGGLLLVASYTFDNCDGEVARIKKMSSEFGAKLDDMSDWIVDASFFAALGYGTAQVNGQQFWFWLGLAAAAGAFIDYIVDLIHEAKKTNNPDAISREEQASAPKQPEDALDWIIYIFHKLSRADFCIIVLILALFNVTWILLPFAAIGAQVYWITDLFERARGYHT
ncbi:MAG: archaetidylinositol phosphate synthase [Gammaproteobacteria bacterium]|jgi:archaetidylinositol phosphate synthase